MLRSVPQQQAAQAAQQAAQAAIQAANQLVSKSPRLQTFQRLRSMPQGQEPGSACPTSRSTASGSNELDRSRRGTHAHAVRHAAGGSGRVPIGTNHGQERRNNSGCERESSGVVAAQNDADRDSLHDAVTQFCMHRPPGRSPLVRLSRGVYLYGNKKLVIAMHNDKLMARIGGGFVQLDKYLADADSGAIAAESQSMAAWQRGRPTRRS